MLCLFSNMQSQCAVRAASRQIGSSVLWQPMDSEHLMNSGALCLLPKKFQNVAGLSMAQGGRMTAVRRAQVPPPPTQSPQASFAHYALSQDAPPRS